MKPKTVDIDLDAYDRDGIVASTHTTANTALTLLQTTLDYARIIGIYSSGDMSGVAFTIVGTNASGESISETVATGPNNGTVVSTKLYKTLVSITPDTTDGSNSVEVGNVATTLSAESVVIPIDHYANFPPTISVDVTGTINFTVQETFMDPFNTAHDSLHWNSITALSSKSADTTAQCTIHARALKIVVNSYSTGAELQAYIVHGR